ncbi:S26 family signal peptidase [Stutzerimonas nitrititolerans]|uniref:S26 family signal peptidase n=1 Tax=Stutzerimonas nitrititolerans TaxID=2482751 RepID=UPI0028A099FA|nr:S26 family signal peptidase [Stutzerimonas nitrititolerans]
MTADSTTARTSEAAPHPRSRLRARIVQAGFAAVGLAALAWAAFVQPLPRLIYNPSDSVPVGWYSVQPLEHRATSLSRPLSVGSIVLTRLPADASALAAQRGYLPAHVPLLKRVGAVAPQHICIVARQVRIDGVPAAAALPVDRLGRPLPPWQHCRPLVEGELFLLSVTNPASFDSRYFGPVSASAVIGIAHPVWLETHP